MSVVQLPKKLELKKSAWRCFEKGDIGIALHWIDGEPAMFLYPCRKSGAKVNCYVIPIDNVHQYVKSNGYPNKKRAAAMAVEAAIHMEMGIEKGTLYRIIDAVLEYTPDLLKMPPEPQALADEASKNKNNVGELSVKSDGETVAEQIITDLDANELAGVSQ